MLRHIITLSSKFCCFSMAMCVVLTVTASFTSKLNGQDARRNRPRATEVTPAAAPNTPTVPPNTPATTPPNTPPTPPATTAAPSTITNTPSNTVRPAVANNAATPPTTTTSTGASTPVKLNTNATASTGSTTPAAAQPAYVPTTTFSKPAPGTKPAVEVTELYGEKYLIVTNVDLDKVSGLELYNKAEGRKIFIKPKTYEALNRIEIPLSSVTNGKYSIVFNYGAEKFADVVTVETLTAANTPLVDPSLNLPDPTMELSGTDENKLLVLRNVKTERVSTIELFSTKDGNKKDILPRRMSDISQIQIPLSTITQGKYNLVINYNGKKITYFVPLDAAGDVLPPDPSLNLPDPEFVFITKGSEKVILIQKIVNERISDLALTNVNEGRKIQIRPNRMSKEIEIPLSTVTTGTYSITFQYNGKSISKKVYITELGISETLGGRKVDSNLPDPAFRQEIINGVKNIIASNVDIQYLENIELFTTKEGRKVNIQPLKLETLKQVQISLGDLSVGEYSLVLHYNGKKIAERVRIL